LTVPGGLNRILGQLSLDLHRVRQGAETSRPAIDIETCRQCGGHLRVIASIEQPAVIERILDHLGHTAETVDPPHSSHPSRAPPQGDRLV
jgi:hypothetical protein